MSAATADSDPAAVLLRKHAGWAEIIFNRPHRKNAIQGPFAQAFLQALQDAESDETLRVLLLRGEGGTFCSGLDLQEVNAHPKPAWAAVFGDLIRTGHVKLASPRKISRVAPERYATNGATARARLGDRRTPWVENLAVAHAWLEAVAFVQRQSSWQVYPLQSVGAPSRKEVLK